MDLPAGARTRLAPATLEMAAILREGVKANALLGSTPAGDLIGALEEVLALWARGKDGDGSEEVRGILVDFLDAGRWPAFLRKISGTAEADRWLTAVLGTIDAAEITLGDLLRLRAEQRPERVQISIPDGDRVREITRRELGERVGHLAAGLRRLLPADPGGVHLALFAPNRLETMLVDLACLSYGIVNVPIAADATPDQVRFILEATKPPLLVVSDLQRLETVLTGGTLPSIRSIVLFDPPEEGEPEPDCRLLKEIEEAGRKVGHVARAPVRTRDLATIMFTSGTTGRPKGIRFSQRNIVYKRFCRAVALPEISEEDGFLCYLPLFHTFGRYLEMTGTLFWGAGYTLMENPSNEAVLRNMRRFRPSVFISIPKRWIQLHEEIVRLAGSASADPSETEREQIEKAVREVTGGRLRWGLSAAGHLDPDIFFFFQRYGVDLMCGFGMTEATGGITMTPPGRYRRGTVGLPLPGIEVQRAEDGELLVRGPYMMIGYDDDDSEVDLARDWFPTGDLFAIDSHGYYSIVDRKKDIYKNVKGQTIAPQRIENLFNEFDEILRTFLVGDGREYNTLLVYPDYEASGGKLTRMSTAELRDYLSSYVVSVNRFLAPYERVVDFDLLPRFFREDKGELTPKGTFVRKVVERNFADLIDALYARPYVSVHVRGVEVRIPNWLLREKGVTVEDLSAEAGGIRMRHTGERLTVGRAGTNPGRVRVGTFVYAIQGDGRGGISPPVVDLDPLLRAPRLWVGNVELARFAGEGVVRRPRRGEDPPEGIDVEGWVRPSLILREAGSPPAAAPTARERGPAAVHAVAAAVLGAQGPPARAALAALAGFLGEPGSEDASLALGILSLLRDHPEPEVRRQALLHLLPQQADDQAAATLRGFLAADPDVLTDEVQSSLLDREIAPAVLRSFLDLARDMDVHVGPSGIVEGRRRVRALLRFVGTLGGRHPRWFGQVRQVLSLRSVPEEEIDVAVAAREEAESLSRRFRAWIDPGPIEPTEPETGRAIGWDQVIGFDTRVDPSVRERLQSAFRGTTLLRESAFLLFDGNLLSGEDLLLGSIWVSYLGAGHGKTVVRVTVRTRAGRSHEFVVKVLREVGPEEAAGEVDWMIRLGTRERAVRLVPDFGGYWPEHRFWSEEYISNETVYALLKRITGRGDPERVQRLVDLWPHLAWSALSTFVEFWQRSGRRVVLSEPVPFNIVVAPHDYQEGSRLVSVSSRMPFTGLAEMIRFLYEGFVVSTEKAFPVLRGIVKRPTAFASFVEALGEKIAIPLLWRALAEMREKILSGKSRAWGGWHDDLAAYIEEIERDGYAPRRFVMAVRRYHTWSGLNPDASLQARAMTLQELYDTYALPDLEPAHPEVRIRFFRMTVFNRARGPLAAELDNLIRSHRDAPLSLEGLLRRMTILHGTASIGEEERYFLARMTYSHLAPAQEVRLELLEEGGERMAELVEEARDDEGALLQIRAALNPKEVMRLHHLFEQSGLSVTFRPDHRFLVGVDENQVVVGGLFYRATGGSTVHMEKIVVSPRRRGKGTSERLMESFLQRMQDAHATKVTTGFFRPHYFYRFGFRVERGFAGLVKDLEEPGPAANEP